MDKKESRSSIITAVGDHPLGLFALIVLVAEIGLAVTVKLVEANPTAVIITIVGIILLLMLMVALVGFRLLGKSKPAAQFPCHGELLGDKATINYFAGGDTSCLPGRWRTTWYIRDEQGNDKLYQVKNPDTGEMEDYPPDVVSMKVRDALISAEAEDMTTRRVYYLEGRMSSKGIVTLMYWGQSKISEEMLVGTVFLKLEKGFHDIQMTGTWSGYDRNNKQVQGKIEWVKTSKD